MQKRFIVVIAGIALILLLSIVAVQAYWMGGYHQYQGYYYRPYYQAYAQYSPTINYPYYYPIYNQANYPIWNSKGYYRPSSDAYGVQPTTVYPMSTISGINGELCGTIQGRLFECGPGLICDYSVPTQVWLGTCTKING